MTPRTLRATLTAVVVAALAGTGYAAHLAGAAPGVQPAACRQVAPSPKATGLWTGFGTADSALSLRKYGASAQLAKCDSITLVGFRAGRAPVTPPPVQPPPVDTVKPAPPPATTTRPPELPRATFEPRVAARTGSKIVRVPVGGDVQSALNAATPGTVVTLAPGRYVGNFMIRSGTTLRTDAPDSDFAPEGRRITGADSVPAPTLVGRLAWLVTPNTSPTLECAPGATDVTVMLLGLSTTSPAPGGAVAVCGTHEERDSLRYPARVTFDRVVCTPYEVDVRRCLMLNARGAAVLGSWLMGHSNGFDAQAVFAVAGGPFTFRGNYLASNGENVMFGGADPPSAELVAHDITITGNWFDKPAAWKVPNAAGIVWDKSNKNQLEFKVGRRVLVARNYFRRNPAAAQIGFGWLLKSTNQGGGAPYSETSDVTWRDNWLTDSDRGLQLAECPDNPAVCMARLAFVNNIVDVLVGSPMTTEGVTDLAVDHNTFRAPGAPVTGLTFNSRVSARLTYTNNRVESGPCPADWGYCGGMFNSADGHAGDPDSSGKATARAILAYHAPGAHVAGNVMTGPRLNPSTTPTTTNAGAGADTAVVFAAARAAVAGMYPLGPAGSSTGMLALAAVAGAAAVGGGLYGLKRYSSRRRTA